MQGVLKCSSKTYTFKKERKVNNMEEKTYVFEGKTTNEAIENGLKE